MAFILNPVTGKIDFGVVSDGTNDAISIDFASQFGVSEDFKDDFSVDNWTDAGTGIEVGTNVIDWDFTRDVVTHRATAIDLGVVSTTAWVLRWKMEVDNFVSLGSSATAGWFGLYDSDETVASPTNQAFIHMFLRNDLVANTQEIKTQQSDGSTNPNSGTFDAELSTSFPVGTPMYFELIRETLTEYRLNWYSDAGFTSLVDTTGSITITSPITGLRYLKCLGFSGVTVLASTFDGTIDNVQFWDGITVPVITSTNWRLRYELDLTNIDDGASATDKTLFFGLGDLDGLSSSSVLQDGYFLRAFTNSGPDAFHVITPDNEAPRTKVADSVMGTTPSVSTKWIELERDSMSQMTTTIYNDSAFTIVDSTSTTAGISGSDNLKYLKAFNDNVASAAGAIDGSIDDITYTDLSAAITMPVKGFTIDALLKQVNGQCGVDLTDLNVYYTFDEASGNLINNATAIGSVDAIANTDGSVGGSVTRSIVGQVSDGYESNGDVPSQAANRIGLVSSNISDFDFMINDGEVYTVNYWIKTNVTAAVQGFGEIMVNQNNTGGSRGFQMGLTGDLAADGLNTWIIRPREGGDIFSTAIRPDSSNGGSFPSFEWHMLTAVADIDARTVNYYLDGRFKVQAGAGGASTPFTGSADTQMQLNSITITQAGRSLQAKIDEYSIWRRGLSTNEIEQLYALNSGGAPLQDYNGGATCFTVDAIIKQLGVNGCGIEAFTTDFSSGAGWLAVSNDVGGVSVTGGQLQGWGSDGGITREIFYDLQVNDGVTVSDTNWIAEFDFQYDVPSTSVNPGHTPFTLSDSTASTDSFQTAGPAIPSVPHPRSISMAVGNFNTFSIQRGTQILVKDTTTSVNSSAGGTLLAGIIDLDAFANTTVYPRLERTSATTYKLSVFTDSARTTHVTGTASGADSPISLTSAQVVTSTNFIHSSNNSAGGGGRVLDGFIDNLSISSGAGSCPTVSVDAILLSQPVACNAPAFITDFSSSTGWIAQGTGVSIAGGVLSGWGQEGGTARALTYDLFTNDGINIDNTDWVAEFDFTHNNPPTNQPAHMPFGLVDSASHIDPAVGNNPALIGMFVRNQPSPTILAFAKISLNDGLSALNENSTSIINLDAFAGTTLYPRLTREGQTITLEIFSDALRTVHITGSPVVHVTALNITGLDFIHSSNQQGGGLARELDGFIDNLSIVNGIGCPTVEVDSILREPACSPLKLFDLADATVIVVPDSSTVDAVGWEIPGVTTPTYVTGIKASIASNSFQGTTSIKFINFPVPTTGNANFGTVGQNSAGRALNTLSASFETHTYLFNPPIELLPGVRYGVAFNESADNSPGLSVKGVTGDFRQTSKEWTDTGSGSPPNYMESRAFTRAPAIDIEVINDRLSCFRIGAVLVKETAWQFREQRADDNLSRTPEFTWFDEPPAVVIASTVGSLGTGYIFKTFKKSDITGSNIEVTCEGTGTGFLPRILVHDGTYDRRENHDINFGNDDPELKGAGSLGELAFPSLPFASQTVTLPAGSINYAGSTQDDITVFIRVRDANNITSPGLKISQVRISMHKVYDFTNSTFVQEVSSPSTFGDHGYFDVSNVSDPSQTFGFSIDACVGFFAGSRSRIGDIIILCLRAFPNSTGDEVVQHVNDFTAANGLQFVGKVSRVKNWMGFLEKNGFIQQDNSDPDWYETKWISLV